MNNCEKGCTTRREARAHLEIPHYLDDCPHMEMCAAHWDESPAGRIVQGMGAVGEHIGDTEFIPDTE